MSYENILYEVDGKIARVTVNRPKLMNALNNQTLEELAHAFDAVRDDEGVRCLLITGAGDKAFIAGADINELAKMKAMQANTGDGTSELTYEEDPDGLDGVPDEYENEFVS